MIENAGRLSQISEYYFSKKLEEIRLMNQTGAAVINLGIGSPDLAPSKETLAATELSLNNPHSHGYSSYRGLLEFREAIGRWYEKTYQVKAAAESEVLPLLGSKEGLFHISMAFLNPRDQALVPNPGYPAYTSVTRLAGAEPISYDLTADHDWQPDFLRLQKMNLSKVKIMWVNYPHMPTGSSARPDTFKKLIDFGAQNNILICHDNPYSLVLQNKEPLSLLKFDPEKKYSLELNSMSKAFNMAGWRIGMVLAHQKIIEAILKVKSNMDSGMFQPLQMGAIRALEGSSEWHEERNAIYRERREVVYQIFDQLNLQYAKDQVGLFVWARVPDQILSVEKWVDQILKANRVFLTPGFIFGSNGDRYVRSSLCASVDKLIEAKRRLENLE
jgi:LL-diaminopimelate aminotransferase